MSHGLFKGDGWDDFIERLLSLAETQNLIGRAESSMMLWWEKDQAPDDVPFTGDDLRSKFVKHSLTFRGNVSYPYIKTDLDIYVYDTHVGQYSLVTFLNGEIADDYHIIFDEFLKGGRRFEEMRDLVTTARRGS